MVSGRRRGTRPPRKEKSPKMIQGRKTEYIVRIITRGDRAAPTLLAIPMTPNVLALRT